MITSGQRGARGGTSAEGETSAVFFDNSCGDPGCLTCFLTHLHEQPRIRTPYSGDEMDRVLGEDRALVERLDEQASLRRFWPGCRKFADGVLRRRWNDAVY